MFLSLSDTRLTQGRCLLARADSRSQQLLLQLLAGPWFSSTGNGHDVLASQHGCAAKKHLWHLPRSCRFERPVAGEEQGFPAAWPESGRGASKGWVRAGAGVHLMAGSEGGVQQPGQRTGERARRILSLLSKPNWTALLAWSLPLTAVSRDTSEARLGAVVDMFTSPSKHVLRAGTQGG